MSEGKHTADEVRGGLKEAENVTEGIRKNINSFADELIGGGKAHQSTGFSNDAKAVGKEIDQSASSTTTTKAGEPTPAKKTTI